ncbi:MAG TPA: FecR domain-containing protein [Spirochaetota bacterium]|nr:FecR domain-containing protein [Spirochaetota bacterium]
MRSLNTNVLVPAAGAVIIAVFSLLLYLDMRGGKGVAHNEEIGTITFKRQTAQRKYASQVVWDDLAQNIPVYNYDSIRTSDMSEAVIKLKDGTEIALNENSMILLAMTKDDVSVDFTRGSIAANRDNADKKLNITAGGAVVALGEGALNLSRGRGEGLDLTLNRGSARVKLGESEKDVATDQRIVVADDVRVFNLTIRLSSPGPNEYFFTPAGKATIAFSWEPALGAGQAWLETAADQSFASITGARPVAGKAATLALPEGISYWRVRTADRATGKIEVSESRRLVLLKREPLVPITPSDGAVVRYTLNAPIILFRWSENAAGGMSTLSVFRDAKMENQIKSVSIAGTSIAVDDLALGTYFWRVERTISAGGKQIKDTGALRRLVVERSDTPVAPELVYPVEGAAVNRLALEREAAAFTWKKNTDHPLTRVEIARDRAFAQIVHTGDARGNVMRFARAFEPGAYYWRAVGIIDEKTSTPPSASRGFRVVETGDITLVGPAEGAIVAPEAPAENASVDFAWRRSGIAGRYRLQVARDASFAAGYRERTIDGTVVTLDDIEPGDYAWRVLLLDDEGNELMRSAPRLLGVRRPLPRPEVLSPADGNIVDMRDSDALNFRWRPVKDATQYRIGLYHVKKGIHNNILTKETRDTAIAMTELERLDVGDFYWTLQALEVSGGRTVARRSPEVRSRFSITLGGAARKPEIQSPRKIYVE